MINSLSTIKIQGPDIKERAEEDKDVSPLNQVMIKSTGAFTNEFLRKDLQDLRETYRFREIPTSDPSVFTAKIGLLLN